MELKPKQFVLDGLSFSSNFKLLSEGFFPAGIAFDMGASNFNFLHQAMTRYYSILGNNQRSLLWGELKLKR